MTRKNKPPPSLDMSFEEALARFVQTDPKELADEFERNRERVDKINKDADERRARLRNALKGPKKRFGL